MNKKRILTTFFVATGALALANCGSNPEITVPAQRRVSMTMPAAAMASKAPGVRVAGGTPSRCLFDDLENNPVFCEAIAVDAADPLLDVPCLECGAAEVDPESRDCTQVVVSGVAYNFYFYQEFDGNLEVCAELMNTTLNRPTTLGIDTDADLDDDYDFLELVDDGVLRPAAGNDPEDFYDSDADGIVDAEDDDVYGDGVLDADEPDCDSDGLPDDSDGNDCGGTCGTPCAAGQGCDVDALDDFEECESGICSVDGVCTTATCDDAVTNGEETDLNCGGGDCDPCTTGDTCVAESDCDSEVCTDVSLDPEVEDFQCQAPLCDDEVMNGDETDVDCGGGTCDPCSSGGTCEIGTDCVSTFCTSGVCLATCGDGELNGDETDIDCGGSCGATCDDAEDCGDFGDCTSGFCDDETDPDAPVCAACDIDNDCQTGKVCNAGDCVDAP